MNKQQYIEFFKECQRKALAITLAKNSDYTGDSDDPFFNFKLPQHLGVMTSEQNVFGKMTDKVSRIASFLKIGILKVKDESVEDALLDLSNYCIILAAVIRSNRKAVVPVPASGLVNCIDEKWGTIDVCRPGRTYQVCDFDGQVIGQYQDRVQAEDIASAYNGSVHLKE